MVDPKMAFSDRFSRATEPGARYEASRRSSLALVFVETHFMESLEKVFAGAYVGVLLFTFSLDALG